MSLIPSGTARRDACYQEVRNLNAPAAKKLREAWFDGPCSGAKITRAEFDRLFDLAGAQLYAQVEAGVDATRRDEAAVFRRTEAKKAYQKSRRKKKR